MSEKHEPDAHSDAYVGSRSVGKKRGHSRGPFRLRLSAAASILLDHSVIYGATVRGHRVELVPGSGRKRMHIMDTRIEPPEPVSKW